MSEEMPETNRHLELRTLLYQFLKHELSARATIGCSQFVYYDPTSAQKRLAPDAFVKLGVPHWVFPAWKTWWRGASEVAVEVVSHSDEGEEAWETKLERYRASGIGEVVRFDPDDPERPIRVWDHVDGDLVERARPDDGVFECTSLGLYWVALPHLQLDRVLRLARDRAGRDLVPTPAGGRGPRSPRRRGGARRPHRRGRRPPAQARPGAGSDPRPHAPPPAKRAKKTK